MGAIITFTMSTNNAKEADDNNIMMRCASCGITEEVDDIKLKKCTACKSVRYCSVKCQWDHRQQHKQACKKRVAELRDEILFKQPESTHKGDCPICCLPLSLDPQKSMMMACCSKVVCRGCAHANRVREVEMRLDPTCPFCRHPTPESENEFALIGMKRIEVNDPAALREKGLQLCKDGCRDYKSAFEYFSSAAGLGDVEAHYHLSTMYREGRGVEKDLKRECHHLEHAAIAGHPGARHNLGVIEKQIGRNERAVRHWIIAANLGHDESIQVLKKCYKDGFVSKEDLATALRAHQAAVDATKSPQRDDADAARARRSN